MQLNQVIAQMVAACMAFASVANVCVMLVIKELIARGKMIRGKKVIVALTIAVAPMQHVLLVNTAFV